MRAKALAASFLALFVASCSCLVPLAAAAARQDHSCCPAPAQPEEGSDCCLRAAPAHGSVAVCAPRVQAALMPSVSPSAASVGEAAVAVAWPSPPNGAAPPGNSSRAPPSPLA